MFARMERKQQPVIEYSNHNYSRIIGFILIIEKLLYKACEWNKNVIEGYWEDQALFVRNILKREFSNIGPDKIFTKNRIKETVKLIFFDFKLLEIWRKKNMFAGRRFFYLADRFSNWANQFSGSQRRAKW